MGAAFPSQTRIETMLPEWGDFAGAPWITRNPEADLRSLSVSAGREIEVRQSKAVAQLV